MNDHFREVRNMISDTPRTDEFIGEYSEWSPAPRKNWPAFSRQLERELYAANERIRMLEEDLMDAKNKHAALVADVALYEDSGERIKRLEEALDTLTLVVGLTPIRGNLAALQEAMDQSRSVLKAKEAKP